MPSLDSSNITSPPSPGAARAAGVLSAASSAGSYAHSHLQQQAAHIYPTSAYSAYAPHAFPLPQASPSVHPEPGSSSAVGGNTNGNHSTRSPSAHQTHHHQSQYTSTSYSPTVFQTQTVRLPIADRPPPDTASPAATSNPTSMQEHSTGQPLAPNIVGATPSTSAVPIASSSDPPKPLVNDIQPSDEPKAIASKKTNKALSNGSSMSKKKTTRRYNASCDACRARKRKCPGRDPETGRTLCTACTDRGIECTYGSLGEPSRLRRADNENEKLRKTIARALRAESAAEKDSILATITEKMLAASSGGGFGSKSRRSSMGPDDPALGISKRLKEDKDEDYASSTSGAPTPSHDPDYFPVKSEPQDHTFLLGFETGRGISAVNSVPSPRPSSDGESAQFTLSLITAEQERGFGDSELESQVTYYIGLALPHGDFQNAPSLQEDHRLLDFYFSWLNPRYALLSRRLFEESRLVNDGNYCTPFLLWSLYAHSAMHCPGFEQQQAHYRARAHLLLTKELCKGKAATLPLAQGLILLAGTAAAKSDHSLAWTLSFTVTGMVIDLLETMGQSTSEIEKSMRKRLYWSHYIWTLVLALALNRKPSVPKLKVELPTGEDETDLWVPALPVRHVENASQIMAIPRLGHELECFRETCQLFSFLEEILTNVYVAAHDKRSPETINAAVKSIQERMTTWQTTQVSSNILIKVQDLPPLCPPPHIVHFNLLLRAIWILLYRPFYNMGTRSKCPIKGARQACNQCASEIYGIFLYLEQNFGVLQLHFSYIYAAYWAAAIDVASAKREGLNPDLLARLSNSSRILLTWVSLPGMRQSVSELIEEIEGLLLADVPRPAQPNEAFSAYEPIHHPAASQEVLQQQQQSVVNEPYYTHVSDMFRPQPSQTFDIADPMMGISPAGDYAPLGGIYWDPSGSSLW